MNEIALNNEIKSDENILNDMYHKFLEIHKFEKSIITDKAPQNFMWIGFIKLFFPNAKVIHCFRNANDNFLSLYKNNFLTNILDGVLMAVILQNFIIYIQIL